MEMNANLVCSSRKNLAKNKGPSVCFLDNVKPRVSGPAPLNDGHFLTMHRMAANRLENFARKFRESTSTQSQIKFLNFSSSELFAQPQMREVILGYHQATAGLLVEPMHYARPKRTAYAAQT